MSKNNPKRPLVLQSTQNKRGRFDGSALSTDCFEDVAHGLYETTEGRIMQSWLVNEICFTDYCQKHGKSPKELASSKDIYSLQKELIEVKKRLMPSAQIAALAYNKQISAINNVPELSEYDMFLWSRKACNPFEVLGEGRARGLNKYFVNRSAIKLANINACLDFIITRPKGCDSFHFVDLCAAPGGWSEYLVQSCMNMGYSSIRGCGMSLKGMNEHGKGTRWNLEEEESCAFEYKIIWGADGTGDIYNWENVVHLRHELGEMPIDAVVCDGGMEGQRDQENQEQVAQKLVICEVAAALSILSNGGIMVLKAFGFQTSLIRNMVQDLATLFEDFVITKPISSRPASAERYLVMIGFKGADGFDGRKWRDLILLGQSISDLNDDHAKKVQSYLDVVDRDMLVLNIKACLGMIFKMEQISNGLESNSDEVNVAAYKREWRL
mmetsp:Transcript_11659/g.17121  ORF Transcript_11659/g.17121 Transcript_11659/m.17121 type:complete len:439 (+) Transcript_11659:51-1367(+)